MNSITEQDITDLLDWLRGEMFDLKTRITRASNDGDDFFKNWYEVKHDAFKEVHELIAGMICKSAVNIGPQRGPSSVAKVEAESKAVKRRLDEIVKDSSLREGQ